MGWIIGFEPMASRATTWRSNQLSYTHHKMARVKGLEPLTYCLEGSCSIQLSYTRRSIKMERVMGIEPTRPAWKAGILAIELHPHMFCNADYYTQSALQCQAFFKKIIKIFIMIFNNSKNQTSTKIISFPK